MIRRYVATALIIFFYSYAAYLIVTDGGTLSLTKPIGFEKLNRNILKKFRILFLKEKSEPTRYEKYQQEIKNQKIK